MPAFRLKNMAVNLNKQGASGYTKSSSPTQVGRFTEIKTPRYEFRFDLNGRIKYIRGMGPGWPHPSEYLKRTNANDWVYYSVGSVGERIFSWLGEYYLPCPPYTSNAIYEFIPFNDPNIMMALGAWGQLYADLYQTDRAGLPEELGEFLDLVRANDENSLHRQAGELHNIIGHEISVLPPDTRHVDYEVIPLTVADGCRYHCGFCCVKGPHKLQARSADNILAQIKGLRAFFGPNLVNIHSLFLGNHDALGVDPELISFAVEQAAGGLGMSRPTVFMFASVDSLLQAPEGLFQRLSEITGRVYINIGLESVHQPTLQAIKKPLEAGRVIEAFQMMLMLNRQYKNLHLSGNFLLGELLPKEHMQSLLDLLKKAPTHSSGKADLYFSPLAQSQKKKDLLKQFFEIKEHSAFPSYVYLIQRL